MTKIYNCFDRRKSAVTPAPSPASARVPRREIFFGRVKKLWWHSAIFRASQSFALGQVAHGRNFILYSRGNCHEHSFPTKANPLKQHGFARALHEPRPGGRTSTRLKILWAVRKKKGGNLGVDSAHGCALRVWQTEKKGGVRIHSKLCTFQPNFTSGGKIPGDGWSARDRHSIFPGPRALLHRRR